MEHGQKLLALGLSSGEKRAGPGFMQRIHIKLAIRASAVV
jgi:hypothetical protein